MGREKIDRKERAYYELGIVTLLALLWGLVMMNRLAIVYLFPFIVPEFKISYAHAGGLASILAITSAFGIWFFGGVSDRIGRKIILIPGTIFFSIMSWFSGLTCRECFTLFGSHRFGDSRLDWRNFRFGANAFFGRVFVRSLWPQNSSLFFGCCTPHCGVRRTFL